METSLYGKCSAIKVATTSRFFLVVIVVIVAITAIIWKPAYMENAQRSKSRRPLGFFSSDRSDRSDRMETNINMYKVQNLCIVNLKGSKVQMRPNTILKNKI